MGVNLSIIIVNYNTCKLLLDCLKSIYENTKKISLEIIIVDNNSTDDSIKTIKNAFPQVIWIQNNTNEGFSRANNRGIEFSKSELVLLLNSDTIIIDNAVEKLYDKFINDSNNIAMATCQLLNVDGTKQKSIFNYNSSFIELMFYNILIEKFLSIFKFNKNNEIRAINGACMIFNKKKIGLIGYLNSDFFMYAEELEWCKRIIKGGFKLNFYDEINIFHLNGGSNTNIEWNVKQRYVSIALLFRKNRGILGYIFYLFISAFNSFINFCLLWKMDELFRINFYRSQKIHLKLIKLYFKILIGTYKKPLKAL